MTLELDYGFSIFLVNTDVLVKTKNIYDTTFRFIIFVYNMEAVL